MLVMEGLNIHRYKHLVSPSRTELWDCEGARWSSGDWRIRPRFAPGTLFHRCSDLGQVVNLSLSV